MMLEIFTIGTLLILTILTFAVGIINVMSNEVLAKIAGISNFLAVGFAPRAIVHRIQRAVAG